MRLHRLLTAMLCALGATPEAAAQVPAGNATVRGVAYDSLRPGPLENAIITIAGTALRATTDTTGRFQIENVPRGTHTFVAQHPALDSIGFTGISTRATIAADAEGIMIAIPSFATLWRAACGGSRPPRDSGFVYGTIRSAPGGTAVPNATVDVTWLDLDVGRQRTVRHTTWRGRSRSDASGSYGICGVPTVIGLRIRAATDSAASGVIDLPGAGRRVQRRDLTVALVGDAGADALGTVAGLVTDSSGAPVANARVIVDGAWEMRSEANGRFALLSASGTRQLEVLGIGMLPVLTAVDVPVRDTVTVHAVVRRVTALDVVRVTAPAAVRRLIAAFDERRRDGSGYMMDSTEIASRGTLASVFHSAPSAEVQYLGTGSASEFVVTFPGKARPGSGTTRCVANLVIDGRQAEFQEFLMMRPREIAAVEVYPRAFSAPQQFIKDRNCGALVVWSKWMFRVSRPE
ncbi:MAG TPA: carboxypeptidase regulatory-like domain-containing protein [Gemmatimonadaceae bacterium]|jgi:hypothetical protein|nr:carboxypeptidase regulatory-like domain-containing protein [Gemmatimonadaceae bacterium]